MPVHQDSFPIAVGRAIRPDVIEKAELCNLSASDQKTKNTKLHKRILQLGFINKENKVKYSVISRNLLFTVVLVYIVHPGDAYAYLDAGTGSYILQIMIAGLLAGLFAMKLFLNKIKHLFKNLFSRKNKNADFKK